MALNSRLLEILQCPNCGGHSFYEKDVGLICNSCGKEYPVVSGIPDMRVYESQTYSSNEFNKTQACYEAEQHNIEAESYEERVIQVFGTKTRMLVQDWAKGLDGITNPMVLDYGCGTGQVSRVLSPQVSPLFAFDISQVSLRKNVKDNGVIGVIANALFLPFKDRAFDLICINGVLHHIIDLNHAIEEITRVAKKFVYISEGIPRTPPNFSKALSYPLFRQQLSYSLYVMLYILYRVRKIPGYIKRKLRKELFRKNGDLISSKGAVRSMYERPLEVNTVESLFVEREFTRKRLRYFTNCDFRGDGAIKRMVTRQLINDVFGTHFDLQMERFSKI